MDTRRMSLASRAERCTQVKFIGNFCYHLPRIQLTAHPNRLLVQNLSLIFTATKDHCWERSRSYKPWALVAKICRRGVHAGASHRSTRSGGTGRASTGGRRLGGGSRDFLAAGGGEEGLGTRRGTPEESRVAIQLFGPSAVNRPTMIE